MGKNLFDFGDKNLNEEISKSAEELDDKTKENIEQLHNKYKGFSEQDLFSELKKHQKSGSLSRYKMEQVMEKMGPFLSESQKKFLTDTINKLEE